MQSQDMSPAQKRSERQWARLETLGQQFAGDDDKAKWRLGRLGAIVAKKWKRKEGTLLAFALAIKMDKPKNIYEWAAMASFYPKFAVAEFQDSPHITWSFYREAYRQAKRCNGDIEDAMEWLTAAHDNEMDYDTFKSHLKDDPRGAWVTKRWRSDVKLNSAIAEDGEGSILLMIDASKVQMIHDLKGKRNVRYVFTVVYDEEKI